ncbi:MAG: hypothetical protein ABL860_01655 [Candidatus Nitrotoga sp.]
MNTNDKVCDLFVSLYREVFAHDGYGEIQVEMRLLKRGQKEVILHCGKQYRFVIDWPGSIKPARVENAVDKST